MHPLPPLGREDEWLQIPLDTLPPDVHQRGQGRSLTRLTRYKTSVPSALSRASTKAFHVASLRSSATSSSTMDPVRRSKKTSIICSKKVSSIAPIISRTAPPTVPSCSQAWVVASIMASTAYEPMPAVELDPEDEFHVGHSAAE